MNIELDMIDLLSDKQKEKVRNAIFKKILASVEAINEDEIGDSFVSKLSEYFDDYEFWDYIDASEIGEELNKVVVKMVKDRFK